MTQRRRYFSERSGRHPTGGRLDRGALLYLFMSTFEQLTKDGLFQEWLGYYCVDAGEVPGKAGENVDAFVFRRLRKHRLWPVEARCDHYSDDDLFDVIELLHDLASEGVKGRYHSFNDCGMHYETFDRVAGQATFRRAMNEILHDWEGGFELLENGEIATAARSGMEDLYEPLQVGDQDAVKHRTAIAVQKFRRRSATPEDQRDAVRDLFDVLEYLRPEAKARLARADEQELFNIANNFGIRHHRPGQRTAYAADVWLPWMFQHCLATIHALTALMAKDQEPGTTATDLEPSVPQDDDIPF